MKTNLARIAAFGLVVCAFATGCSKKEEAETKTEPNPAASSIAANSDGAVAIADAATAPMAAETANAATEGETGDLSSHEDEDTAAAQEIHKDNYKAELDRLAKEIENP